MEKPKVTPKDFFLWFAAMAFLYVSVFAFVSLIFSYLNYAFPEKLYLVEPYSSGISYQMASIIVLLPLYLLLMRVIRGTIQADPSRGDLWVRRWALYLTLFIAGVTVAADLITLLMYFFNGNFTIRFFLKVAVLLLVAGGFFLHFLADLRGYWVANPSKARMLPLAIGALVIITIIAGFMIVGTPWQARLYRFDEQKVIDLQSIQSQVTSYWQTKQQLPSSLAQLTDSISGFMAPTDLQSGEQYEYRATGATTFEICASFNAKTQAYSETSLSRPVGPYGSGMEDSWSHAGGHQCFFRTIDPAFYPPITKPLSK